MENSTKKKRSRQPRSPRVARKAPRERIPSFRDIPRETLLDQIQTAVSRTAERLVQDEVLELVGEPWSRKGDSALRRNGQVCSTICLNGEPLELRRPRVRDLKLGEEYLLQT